jgi:uncharacterized lipoprotein YbaY
MNERAILAVLVCLPLFAGPRTCAETAENGDARIQAGTETFVVSGEVHYRERMLLTAGASLRVIAEDSSKLDADGGVLAASSRAIMGSPPYSFSLPIDASHVDETRDVTLRAEISVDGVLLFASVESIAAFTDGRPREGIEILVKAVSPPG